MIVYTDRGAISILGFPVVINESLPSDVMEIRTATGSRVVLKNIGKPTKRRPPRRPGKKEIQRGNNFLAPR